MRAPPDASPFTPEKVHDILREVLKDAPLPPVDGHAVTHLARVLTVLWQRARNWAGPWSEELERLQKFSEAIQTLTQVPPEWRRAYAANLAELKRHPHMRDAVKEVEADITAFDALLAAAWTAHERKLPVAPDSMLATKRIKRRRDYEEDLWNIFRGLLSKSSMRDGYRFVAAVAPYITGKSATWRAVETALARKSK